MKIIPILFLFVFSLSAIAEGKLVFATHTGPPLSDYLEEVIREALKPYSIEVEVIDLPGSRVIVQVNSGRIDGDLARVEDFNSISDFATANYLRISEPLVLAEIAMITLAENKLNLQPTWKSINQGSVAFLRGSKTIRKYLREYNRVSLNDNLQLLELVKNKRVDSAVMFGVIAEHLLKQNPELNQVLKIHQPPVMSFHLFTYLHKKHAELVPKLEHSLRQLKQNGFIQRTAIKYHVTPPNDVMP